MPAIYNLATRSSLPSKIALIGADLADGDAASWAKHLHEMLESFVGNASSEFDVDKIDEDAWKTSRAPMSYVKGEIDQARSLQGDRRRDREGRLHDGNVIFYMAIAGPVLRHGGDGARQAGLAKQDDNALAPGRRREPIGHDVESAIALNKTCSSRSKRTRSSASTISSARRPCRPSRPSASPRHV